MTSALSIASFFFFFFIVCLCGASADNISLVSDGGGYSTYLRTGMDSIFNADVHGVGSYSLFIMADPASAMLRPATARDHLIIEMRDGFLAFDGTDLRICIGVFVEAVAEESMIGCIGEDFSCMHSTRSILRRCDPMQSTRDRLVVSTRPHENVIIMMATSGLPQAASVLLQLTDSPEGMVDGCAVFSSLLETGFIIVTADAPVDRDYTVVVGVTSVLLKMGSRTTSAPVEAWKNTGRQGAAEILVYNTESRCYQQLHQVIPLDYHPERAFGGEFEIFMRYPDLVVTISFDPTRVTLGADFFVVFTVFDPDGALVDSKTQYSTQKPPIIIALALCTGAHVVVMHAIYPDGSRIFVYNSTFDPGAFCLSEGYHYTCFCPEKRDYTLDIDMLSSAVTIPAEIRGGAAMVKTVATTRLGTQIATFCVAVDFFSGRSITRQSQDNTCVLPLHSGVYMIRHGVGSSMGMVRSFFRDVNSYDIAVVCSVSEPVIEFKRYEAREGGAEYMRLSPGIFCPNNPIKAEGRTISRTDVQLLHVTWDYAANHGDVFQVLSAPAGGTIVWYPDPGYYRANVTYLYAGSTEQMSSVYYHSVASSAHRISPPSCSGVQVSLTYNRLPQLETDGGAFAVLSVVSQGNTTGRTRWAVQVTQGALRGKWMSLREDLVWTQKLLATTDYSFKLLRVDMANEGMRAVSACYHETKTLTHLPPIIIRITSPVETITCGLGAFVLFDVYHENIDSPPVPVSGIDVDIYSSAGGTSPGVTRFVAGPIDDGDYVDNSLIMYFKMGLTGEIVDRSLDRMFSSGLRPPLLVYSVEDVKQIDTDDHISDTKTSRFHCGKDSRAGAHEVALFTANPTSLKQLIVDNTGARIEPLAKYMSNGISRATFQVAPVEIGKQETAHFGVFLSPGLSTRVVPRWCPMRNLEYSIPPYVPLDVNVTALPSGQGTEEERDALCRGKHLFSFSIPGVLPNPISYKTDDDIDIGSVTLYNGAVFPLTIGRMAPVYIYAFYNGANDNTGVRLSCSVEIPVDLFSVDRYPSSIWASSSAQVHMVSSTHETCSVFSGTTREDKRDGGMVLRNEYYDAAAPPLMTLRTSSNLRVLYRGYPVTPPGNVYTYTGLGTGAYVATVQMADRTKKYNCTRSRLFFIQTKNDAEVRNLVDMDKTSQGWKQMLCPRSMFPQSQAWLEYYTIALYPDMHAKLVSRGMRIKVSMWTNSNPDPLAVFYAGAENLITYRLPRPGGYTAQLTVVSDHGECSVSLPQFSVEEPLFTASSFVMEVMQYPTCGGTADGVLRIEYPSHIRSQVGATVISCVSYIRGAPCSRDISIDTSTHGYVFIAQVPFASSIVIRYEVMGACSFDKTYAFTPSPNIHPVSISLKYTPSCAEKHQVRAYVDLDSGPATLTHGNGKRFLWQVNGVNVSVDDILWIDPLTSSGANISLMIVYNGVCSVKDSVVIDRVFVPPRVSIDPLLFHVYSRSLPIFCPGENDAMLYASFSPPIQDKSDVFWHSGKNIVPRENIVFENSKTVLAHTLAPGVYTAKYSRSSGGITCMAEDTVVIPQKERYHMVDSLEITSASCPGGVASALLRPNRNAAMRNELDVFLGDMFITPDRAYVKDMGRGTTLISGVPDGHIMNVKIPYDNKYVMSKQKFCKSPYVIDFGAVATPPIFAAAQISSELPVFYSPAWHGGVDVVWGRDILLRGDDTCTTKFATSGTDWAEEIYPLAQALSCSYDQPESVTVTRRFLPTGDVFYSRTLYPLVFADELRLINPSFSVTTPAALRVIEVRGVNEFCNMELYFRIAIKLAIPAHTQVLADRARISGYVSISTDMVTCKLTPYVFQLTCTVKRGAGVLIDIPYISSSGGECLVTANIAQVGSLIDRYVPIPVVVQSNTSENDTRVCLDAEEVYCHSVQGAGIHRFVNSRGIGCDYDHTLVISLPSEDKPRARKSGEAVSPVQVIHPSCIGSHDGAIVWTVDPVVEYLETDSESVVELGDDRTTVIQNALGQGVHWLKYRLGPNDTDTFQTVFLYDPKPLSYVVQPADLPPPQFRPDAANVFALPKVASGGILATVYLSGEGANSRINVIGRAAGSTVSLSCDVIFYGGVYWTHSCNVFLQAGYAYQFDVTCLGDTEKTAVWFPERKRDVSYMIASIPALDVRLRVLKSPSSPSSADGVLSIDIIGGEPPFTVMSTDAIKTAARQIMLNNVKPGSVKIGVIDALGSVLYREKTIIPHASFEIVDAVLEGVQGCGSGTSTSVLLYVTSHSLPTGIGSWNQQRGDTAIASCNDTRIRPTVFVAGGGISIAVTGSGSWHFALCLDGWLLSTLDRTPVVTIEQTSQMKLSVITGESCAIHGMSMFETKKTAAIKFSGAVGPVSAVGKYSIQPRVFTSSDSMIRLPGLAPGVYYFSIYEEQLRCESEVAVTVENVGTGVCGTCDKEKATACLGCDGIPHSGAVMDACGVCNGENACADTCEITSTDEYFASSQMKACASQNRRVTFHANVTLRDVSVSASDFLWISGSVTIAGDSYLSSNGEIRLTGGVVLTDRIEITSPSVEMEDVSVVGCEVVFRRVLSHSGQRRLFGVDYSEEQRQETINDIVDIVISGTPIRDSSVAFEVDVSYNVSVFNSTFYRIRIIGEIGHVNITLGYNASIPSLDIESATVGDERPNGQVVCALFVAIPTLSRITRQGMQFNRNTFSCSGFGAVDDSAREIEYIKEKGGLGEAGTVALVSFSVVGFLAFAFFLPRISTN